MKNNHVEIFEASSAEIYSVEQKISIKAVNYTDMLIQVILSMLSSYAFVQVFTSAFSLEVSAFPFFIVTFLLSLLMVLMVRGKKAGIILLFVVIVSGALFLWLKWDGVVSECAGIYESITEAFGERYGFETPSGYLVEPDKNVTWVMLCFSFVPVWMVSYTYGRKMYPVLCCTFLMLPLFFCMAAGVGPSVASIMVFTAVELGIFTSCRSEYINRDCVAVEETEKTRRMRFVSLSAVTVVLLIVLSCFVLYPLFEDQIKDLQERYSSHFLQDLLADIEGNPFKQSKDGLTEGDLSEAESVVRTGETTLKAVFSEDTVGPVYLKGYTADQYNGRKWYVSEEPIPETAMTGTSFFMDAYHTDEMSNGYALYRNPLLYYPALRMMELQHNAGRDKSVMLTRVNGRGEYIYLPYAVNGVMKNMPDPSYVAVKDLYIRGTSENNLIVPFMDVSTISDVSWLLYQKALTEGIQNFDGSPVIRYMDGPELLNLLSEYGSGISADELYGKAYNEYILKEGDGTEKHYRLLESCIRGYEAYVNEQCLQVPENPVLSAAANEIVHAYGLDRSDMDPYRAAEAVRDYLKRTAVYTLNPGKIVTDGDFVEAFLTTKKAGYCVHFAAAGTLLLRYLGVPARYTEGYLCPQSEGNKEIILTDYNAHAWSEIFVPGYGFMPVEMTPGEDEEEEESTEESSEEPETEPEKETEPETSTENPSEQSSEQNSLNHEPEHDPSSKDQKKDSFLLWFILICLLLLLIFIVIFVKYSKRIKPLEKLRGEDNRDTYLSVYEELKTQAEKNGQEISIDDSANEVIEKLPAVDPEKLRKLQNLSKEVYYSNREVTDETVDFVYDLYESGVFKEKPPKEDTDEIEEIEDK